MKKPKNICLMVIWQVDTNFPNAYGMLLILSYSKERALDLTDIKSIQCVVGHIEDWGIWGLVNHSGPLVHAVFTEVDGLTVM
jgi:hypothetical protein